MPEFDYPEFDYKERDEAYWRYLEARVRRTPGEIKPILMNFQTFTRRRELVRFIAHYELFKHVIDLPGCVVELGVFRGASFFTWTKLMETFCPGDRHRLVYGFDHFEGLANFSEQDPVMPAGDGSPYYACDASEIQDLVQYHNQDTLVPGIRRCEIIAGDICETVPKFVADHPGVRIALLHFDLDLYRPTRLALEHLYGLVVKGGVICFDEYGCTGWPGESKAVEEVFASLGIAPVLKKFNFSASPGAYFLK